MLLKGTLHVVMTCVWNSILVLCFCFIFLKRLLTAAGLLVPSLCSSVSCQHAFSPFSSFLRAACTSVAHSCVHFSWCPFETPSLGFDYPHDTNHLLYRHLLFIKCQMVFQVLRTIVLNHTGRAIGRRQVTMAEKSG